VKKALFKGLLWALRKLPLEEDHLYTDDLCHTIYMARFWVIREGTCASGALSLLTGGRYVSCRLHHIRHADEDRDVHNHPFRYCSWILKGWYMEDMKRLLHIHSAGDVVYGFKNTFHRIVTVPHGGVWTLFFMGPNSHEWGFWRNGLYMDRDVYFAMKDWNDGESE
jgi:esterase/lipase superfamily enzyme